MSVAVDTGLVWLWTSNLIVSQIEIASASHATKMFAAWGLRRILNIRPRFSGVTACARLS